MPRPGTTPERLATVENEMAHVRRQLEDMNGKLDGLIALKHKGMGAFWLAAGLAGIPIAGFFTYVLSWFRA